MEVESSCPTFFIIANTFRTLQLDCYLQIFQSELQNDQTLATHNTEQPNGRAS